MRITLKSIIEAQKKHPSGEARAALRTVILSSLNRQQENAYRWTGPEHEIDTAFIADKLRVSLPGASILLKQLFDMGLVTREISLGGRHGLTRKFLYKRAS